MPNSSTGLDEWGGALADYQGGASQGTNCGLSYNSQHTNNNCYVLDGVDDVMEEASPTTMDTTDNISISLWVKLKSDVGSQPDANPCLVSRQTGANIVDRAWVIHLEKASDTIYFNGRNAIMIERNTS